MHLFVMRGLLRGQIVAEISIQSLDDLDRGHAAELVKERLAEIGRTPEFAVESLAPRAVVKRHRVGQRAVAIENVAVVLGGVESNHVSFKVRNSLATKERKRRKGFRCGRFNRRT